MSTVAMRTSAPPAGVGESVPVAGRRPTARSAAATIAPPVRERVMLDMVAPGLEVGGSVGAEWEHRAKRPKRGQQVEQQIIRSAEGGDKGGLAWADRPRFGFVRLFRRHFGALGIWLFATLAPGGSHA
ncbi:MAG: hypothetical protein AMXMBFR77_04540 [Phycisphaerales bacterium]